MSIYFINILSVCLLVYSYLLDHEKLYRQRWHTMMSKYLGDLDFADDIALRPFFCSAEECKIKPFFNIIVTGSVSVCLYWKISLTARPKWLSSSNFFLRIYISYIDEDDTYNLHKTTNLKKLSPPPPPSN